MSITPNSKQHLKHHRIVSRQLTQGLLTWGPKQRCAPQWLHHRLDLGSKPAGGLVKWRLWWFCSSRKTPVPTLVLFYIISQHIPTISPWNGNTRWGCLICISCISYLIYIYITLFGYTGYTNILKFPGCVRCHVTKAQKPSTVSAPGPPRASVDHPQARYRRGEPSCAAVAQRCVTLPSKVHCFRSIPKIGWICQIPRRSQGSNNVMI